MFCRKCGTQIESDEKFCYNCGEMVNSPSKLSPSSVKTGAALSTATGANAGAYSPASDYAPRPTESGAPASPVVNTPPYTGTVAATGPNASIGNAAPPPIATVFGAPTTATEAAFPTSTTVTAGSEKKKMATVTKVLICILSFCAVASIVVAGVIILRGYFSNDYNTIANSAGNNQNERSENDLGDLSESNENATGLDDSKDQIIQELQSQIADLQASDTTAVTTTSAIDESTGYSSENQDKGQKEGEAGERNAREGEAGEERGVEAGAGGAGEAEEAGKVGEGVGGETREVVGGGGEAGEVVEINSEIRGATKGGADSVTSPPRLPQIDCSTARIPITDAIFELFTKTYGYTGPAPLASRTHGAWLNLADKKADILFLVAPTTEELDYFAEKKIDIEMKVYGYDGLVFISNVSNPIRSLTPSQIRDIYSGKITNWSDLGGENADIIVYIRNPESGSQRLFESLVWDGYKMPDFDAMRFREGEIDPVVTQRATQILVDEGMESVTKNVILNQYSIGFNIMSYIDSEFSNSALRLFSINGYEPTTENFASGNYPLLTTSYVAIRADEPENSPARQLYDWVGTQESYDLISRNSTLTVGFSDSLIIKAGMGIPKKNEATTIQNEATTSQSEVTSYQSVDLTNMIPRLNREYLTRQDLLPYNLEELGYLRNGVFALSGRIFSNQKYAAFFSSQNWYYGNSTDDNVVSGRFNDFQRKNLMLIIEREEELK